MLQFLVSKVDMGPSIADLGPTVDLTVFQLLDPNVNRDASLWDVFLDSKFSVFASLMLFFSLFASILFFVLIFLKVTFPVFSKISTRSSELLQTPI